MFQGFSPETIDFLWGIRMNNNREWFQDHKKQYVDTLYQPMKDLGADLFQPFLEKPGTILKVSRIYRDARMHPPVPYKESLWICIRQDVDWWAENPCLFFELRPEGASYGFALLKPRPVTLEAFRAWISAHPEEFLTLVDRVREASGIPLTAALSKRPKVPEDSRLAPYFAWKGEIECIRQEPVSPGLFGPELEQRVAGCFGALTELYEFFGRFRV